MTPEEKARIDAIEAALLARWPETRIAPTLERISALVDMLGSPQLTYPTIHIGGTNGKTTTSRMIDSLLFEMGLRTGRFTSPHLESYLERICINGQPIDAKELIFSFNDIAAYLDLMDTKFDNPISFFEAITALAFAAFAEHPIDVGIIEVGMGGEWDATNVVDADVSVIMPIGLDHMEYLGNSIAEIAATKAGIIKEQGFVVLAGPTRQRGRRQHGQQRSGEQRFGEHGFFPEGLSYTRFCHKWPLPTTPHASRFRPARMDPDFAAPASPARCGAARSRRPGGPGSGDFSL